MVRSLREGLEGARFKDWEMPATQFGGIHLGMRRCAFDSPFRNVKDYEDYLARLHRIPHVLDETMGHMRDGMRDHLMPPKYLLEKVSSQAQEIADESMGALEKSPFTDPLNKFPESICEADRKRLRAVIEDAVKDRSRAGVCEVREVRARGLRPTWTAWIPASGRCRMETRVIALRCGTRRRPIFAPDQIHAAGHEERGGD